METPAKKEYTASELMTMFREFAAYKNANVVPNWRLTRALYRGDFWNVFKTYLKDYSITPDWNYFEYTVQAYLNSIYSGAFIGTITPTKSDDEKFVQGLNAFVAYQWNKWGMKSKFLHVGSNGELYNLGAVRVDWNTDGIKLKNVSAQELYFDPSVSDYREGRALFIERSVNIDTLKRNPDFKAKTEEYITLKQDTFIDKTVPNRVAGFENVKSNKNRTVSLIEAFIRNEDGKLDQVYILDEEVIVHTKEALAIDRFPVVVFAPQPPDGNPYGSSKLDKIMNTVVALNLLDSMEATQPYRLLNRVRFVNVDGRINMRSFADYGNTPNASFEVKGDPRTIVYYQDVPTIPDLTNIKRRLEDSIFQVTGVDPAYKGRMTNSVQTTGGIQSMQARVTMLTDNSRITMLEEFCEDLTKLILDFYFAYSTDKDYNVPKLSATGTNKVVGSYDVNFGKMREHQIKYDYNITASTLLPMNQVNLFESAKILYEMQGQYSFKKQVITEQDLVRYSDFPQKDLILQRLERQEQEDTGQNLIADLTNFASIFSKLLAKGLTEEQAAQQAITILIEEKNAMQQDPSVGLGFK